MNCYFQKLDFNSIPEIFEILITCSRQSWAGLTDQYIRLLDFKLYLKVLFHHWKRRRENIGMTFSPDILKPEIYSIIVLQSINWLELLFWIKKIMNEICNKMYQLINFLKLFVQLGRRGRLVGKIGRLQ